MSKDKKNSQVIPVIKKQKKELSKAESLFNYRIKRVKRLKDSLNLVSEQISDFHKLYQESIPLFEKKNIEQQVVLVKTLIEVFDDKILKGKKQQKKFKDVILYILEDLIFDEGQEGLEELYERFAEQTVEETRKEADQGKKDEMFRMMNFMGVEVSDDEKEKIMNDDVDDEFIHNFEKKFSSENIGNSFFGNSRFQERKKTKKQIERESREAEELNNISKTVKKVYKELVVELHPDKETDEVKRAVKTELMQEVTEAYRDNDLFKLLSIQLSQVEGLDNTNLSEDKIEYFNTMLLKQARELEQQKLQIGYQAGIPPQLLNVLGKKQFTKLATQVIEDEVMEEEIRLENTNKQIQKLKSKNKEYIKNYIEDNYENFFETLDFPFAIFDGLDRR